MRLTEQNIQKLGRHTYSPSPPRDRSPTSYKDEMYAMLEALRGMGHEGRQCLKEVDVCVQGTTVIYQGEETHDQSDPILWRDQYEKLNAKYIDLVRSVKGPGSPLVIDDVAQAAQDKMDAFHAKMESWASTQVPSLSPPLQVPDRPSPSRPPILSPRSTPCDNSQRNQKRKRAYDYDDAYGSIVRSRKRQRTSGLQMKGSDRAPVGLNIHQAPALIASKTVTPVRRSRRGRNTRRVTVSGMPSGRKAKPPTIPPLDIERNRNSQPAPSTFPQPESRSEIQSWRARNRSRKRRVPTSKSHERCDLRRSRRLAKADPEYGMLS